MLKREEKFFYFMQFLMVVAAFIFLIIPLQIEWKNFWTFYGISMLFFILAKLSLIERKMDKKDEDGE
jgi:hypothetical protein